MKAEIFLLVCLYILGIQDGCSGRHIGHEIIQVTQHTPSPRSRREVGLNANPLIAEDFPKQMEFTLHLKDRDKKLVLNKYVTPHDVIVSKHNGVVQFDPHKIQYAVYQDASSLATMVVECSQLAETCTLEGTFYHGMTKWNLSPLQDLKEKYNVTESLNTFDKSQTSRVVPNNSSAKAKPDPEHLYLQLLEKVKKEGHTVREKRATVDCNIIEMEVLTDSSVYEYFVNGEAGYELAGESMLLKHYLALFGELDLRYKCLIEYGICLRIFLVRIRINTNPGSDWTNTFLGNGNVDALQTLFNCGEQRDGETTADLLLCTTRLDLEYEGDPTFRALAFFGVLCQSQFGNFRAYISEDLGDNTDLVLASNLLSPLNTTLDSAEIDPSCNSSFLFIGTQFDIPPHSNDTITNPWKFSNCSRVQIQQWLDFLDSGSNCLKTGSITVEDYDTYLSQTPFAGEIFDLDFQCQNTYGLSSFATIGPGETSIFDVGDICWKGVYCDVGGDNTFRTRVYNGSPCGCKKICIKNECVREFNIPLGGACEGCCECSDHNAICDCETKTCVCSEGFADDNGDMANGTCIPVQPPGGSCPTNETCEDENSICNASNICDCREGWVLRDGVCVRFCDNNTLPYVANGVYIPQDNVAGSIANLQCDMGYTPNSSDTCSICTDDGTFTSPSAACVRDCGCPPDVSNGDYILIGNTLLGSVAFLKCCDGYSTNSKVGITCQDTPEGWSNPSENCTINDCGITLPYVTNGTYVANHGTTVGSIGTLQCDYGYVPKSEDDCIVCLFNGSWAEPKTYCIRDCGCPPRAPNGDYVLEVEGNSLLGSKAFLECCEGFSTDSTVKITCQDTEQGWTYPAENCTINDCGSSLPYVTNGAYVANHGTTVGSIGTLQCDYGYVPKSEDDCIVCLFNGSWSQPKTYCIRDCGEPPVASNGDYILKVEGNTLLGAKAQLECCEGYSTESFVEIICEDNTQGWSTPSENCTINDCGETLPYVTNGKYVANHGTTVGSIGTLQCDYGYAPISDDDCIACLINGSWAEPKTDCIRDCGTPPVPFGGRFELNMPGNTTLGAMATLVCCDVCASTSTIMITCEDTEQGWSDPAENCTVNDCGPTFPIVQNGAYQVSGTLIGSFGQLVCDYGYTPNATDICIVCLPNGVWTDPGTGCIRDCGFPPLADNGDFVLNMMDTTTLGAVATLYCCNGYSTDSMVSITCEDTSQGWSTQAENCTINDCGSSLPYVTNGGYVANHGTTVGSIGTLKCDFGYVPISDDDAIVCLFNGSWSEPKTECIRDCGLPPEAPDGEYRLVVENKRLVARLVTGGNTLLGAKAILQCCEGYSTDNLVEIVCEDNAQGWSTPSENCMINDCGSSLPYVTNGGYVANHGTTVGSIGTLKCDFGYVPISDDDAIVCLFNGSWSEPKTECIRDCGLPPEAPDGEYRLVVENKRLVARLVTDGNTLLGAKAILQCCEGYSTDNLVEIVCEDNAQGWSTPSENCTINDCGTSLPYVTNGMYMAKDGTIVGSIGTLQCDFGYIPVSCETCIVCTSNGSWSEPRTSCIRDCGVPPKALNGEYCLDVKDSTTLGASASLVCDDGFSTMSAVSITCEDYGDGWSDPTETCTINDCGSSLPYVTNGVYMASNGTTVGSLGTLECDYGYVPESCETCVVCLSNGSWSDPLTSCLRDCGVPPKALNGEYCLDDQDSTTLGHTATLVCDDGFSTDSPLVITCEDNESGWSDPSGTCMINVCDDAGLPSVSYGSYASQGNEVGCSAILYCDDGYLPDQCDTCSVCQMDGTWSDPNTTCVRKSGIGECCCPGECADDLVCNPLSNTCTCPEGTVQNGTGCVIDCPCHFVQFETSCYFFGTADVLYSAALDICDAFDSSALDCRLVQIDSNEELNFVKDFISNRALQPPLGYWNDVFQAGNNSVSEIWRTTGDPLIITDWDVSTGQPNDRNGQADQFCTVFAKSNSYKWIDQECQTDERGGTDRSPYFPLCEIDYSQGTTCPSPTPK